MSEIAEQIQNSVLPEPPVAEIPPQAAATEAPESQTPNPEHPVQDEVTLASEINELWRLHGDYAVSMRSQSQNLRSLRAELGEKLSAMKALLAKPGCSGKWSSWLKEHKIARSTADRLVAKHERSLNPNPNCHTDSISEPTEEEIQNLLEKIAPKLRRVLRTPQGVYRFIDLLASSFVLDRKDAEKEFTLVEVWSFSSSDTRPRQ
jgi:hypothetical protein